VRRRLGDVTRDNEHRYYFGTRPLMGVSQVLNVVSPFEFSNPVAMMRGTAVHMATEFYDKGTLDVASVDPAISGYLAGWRQFRAEMGFEPDLDEIEVIVADILLGVAGTYDRFGAINQRRVLLDIKTGQKHWRYDVQLAAYDYLRQKYYDEPEADELATVYLNDSGGYQYQPVVARSSSLSLFIAGAAILRARIANGE
jgi:hypothetical protein